MISVMYTNACSIKSKLSELEVLANDKSPDIIMITETWCSEKDTNASLKLLNYDLIPELRCDRCDTTNGIGGGILVYVKEGLNVFYQS